MAILRDERKRRCDLPREERAERARRLRDVLVKGSNHILGVLDLEEHRPAGDLPHGLEAVLEVRHDAEIPATAAQGPEQVRVGLRTRGHERAVREDDIRGDQVVQGEAMAPREVPDSAAEGQARDPGRGDDPARRREPECMVRVVEVAPGRAALRPHRLRAGVDADPAHPDEVDDESAVRGPEAGHAVPAAPHGDRHSQRVSGLDRRDDIRHSRASHDGRGPLVNHRVVNLARLVVPRVPGDDHVAPHLPFQLLKRRLLVHRARLPKVRGVRRRQRTGFLAFPVRW